MLLKNKVAAITGGGRGIGRSIAMQFAREGADVVLIARTTRQINQVALDVQNLGCNSLAVIADISNESEISDTFTQILNHFGRVDILVNNAGVEFKNPFMEMTMDDWDQTMNINARGTVLCTKAVLPGMLKRKAGNIINIASGAGLRGLPGSAAYGSSKAAIIALSFALADELRDQGIRVNVISPGLITWKKQHVILLSRVFCICNYCKDGRVSTKSKIDIRWLDPRVRNCKIGLNRLLGIFVFMVKIIKFTEKESSHMIQKKILNPLRVRVITGKFCLYRTSILEKWVFKTSQSQSTAPVFFSGVGSSVVRSHEADGGNTGTCRGSGIDSTGIT